MRTTLLPSLVAAGVLAVPAAAAADSIVYVDGGNVWSATPDGARRVQLTDGGGWHSPTQADDGTIAAVQGTGPIRVMARDGRPLRTITTTNARTGNGGTFDARPVDLSLSPDGTRIAYAYVAFSCPPASTCREQSSTFYTRSDVTEATPQAEWGNQFGASAPEWITNDRTLVQSGSHVDIDPLGGGDYSYTTWVVGSRDFGDPELSRDGRRLATTFHYGSSLLIAFFAVDGDARTELPPALPTAACSTSEGDEKAGDPTWSPDGAAAAFHAKEGIHVVRFSSFGPEGCGIAGETILTPTGTNPDWGPADPPAARWVAPGPGTGTAGGGPATGGGVTPGGTASGGAPGGGTPAGGPGTPAPAAVRVTTAAASRTALRAGLLVRATVARPGRVTVTLSRGGRAVARASTTARAAGAVSVRLPRLGARQAAALRGRTVRLTVATGGTVATRTFTVR